MARPLPETCVRAYTRVVSTLFSPFLLPPLLSFQRAPACKCSASPPPPPPQPPQKCSKGLDAYFCKQNKQNKNHIFFLRRADFILPFPVGWFAFFLKKKQLCYIFMLFPGVKQQNKNKEKVSSTSELSRPPTLPYCPSRSMQGR